MEKLPNLRALRDFLGKEPDSLQLYSYTGLQSDFFDPKFERLRDALELYDRTKPSNTAKPASGSSEFPEIDNLLKEHERGSYLGDGNRVIQLGDTLLFDMTQMAAENSRKGGYANYILGCFYDSWQRSAHITNDVHTSYQKAAYFYGRALEKGYVTNTSRKAYADACAHLGWFDTALYWYPKHRSEGQLAEIYLSHWVRYCKEQGVSFPKSKNHIVTMGENPRAKELGAILSGMFRKEGSVHAKLNALERKVPPQVKEFNPQLDLLEEKLLKKRKRSRRKWWLFFLLLTACAAPGFLNGNGEGLQGLSYKLFIATYAPFGNELMEGMNFAQRLASNLDDNARTNMAGAGMVVHAIATMFWTLILRFFGKKKHARAYGELKRQFYEDARLEGVVAELDTLNPAPATAPEGFKNLNALAAAWHDALVANAPIVTIPSLYGDTGARGHYTAGENLLYNYDAFVGILEAFSKEPGKHVLLWCGDELAAAYAGTLGIYQQSFLSYFTAMFESIAMRASAQSRYDSWAKKQIKILQDKIQDQVRQYMDSITPKPVRKTAPSESIGQMIAEELNKASNLLSHGIEATNEEIIDALERSGKISSTEADKARFSPRGLEELKKKDDDRLGL